MLRVLCLLACLSAARPVAAQSSTGWRTLADAGERAVAERLLRSAIALIECATEMQRCPEDAPPPDLAWAQAAVRLERASELLPDDEDLRFLHAVAASQSLGEAPAAARVREVITLFEALRERAPEHAAAHVAFELAVLRTRASDMDGAVAEYERVAEERGLLPTPMSYPLAMWELLLLSWHSSLRPSSVYGNWAEVTMLSGDAERAIALYDRALAAVPESSFSAALALWGRALAEERAGAHASALETTCRAIDLGLPADIASLEESREATRARWGPFAALHDPDVFFEPRYEIRAYEALGHECLAGRSASAEGRRAQLERALSSWRFFLLEGGESGPWADSAHRAEARLGERGPR